MRRTKEEAEKTRQDLLSAALTVFSQNGYEAARLNDIAEIAEVTRGAIYHHFENKAGLYMALIEEASQVSGKAIEQAIQEGGTLPDIVARILIYTLNLLEDDQRFREVLALSLFQSTTVPELQAFTERRESEAVQLIESIQGFFQMGIEQGELRSDLDPATIARAFLAYQNGLAHLWLSNTKAFSIKANATALATVFLQGIVA